MLKKGDKVAFVSPSSWLDEKSLEYAVAWFENQGFKVVLSKHIFDVDGYCAGTPLNRAKDINSAFEDKGIKAIFCSRGGAGSLKVLPYLDYDLIKKNPKPVFGFSDSTALQNALYTKAGMTSYTGFLPAYDIKTSEVNQVLEKSLTGVFQAKPLVEKNFEIFNSGEAEGVLIGGCLSVFTSLCGTDYMPDLKDKILLLEDVGEKTYRIDLMLEQLKQQPHFDGVKGIIFGIFEKFTPADQGDEQIKEILQKFALSVDIPVFYNLDYGHVQKRVIMPIGARVKMSSSTSTIQKLDDKNQNLSAKSV